MQAIQSGDIAQRPEISLDALTTRYLQYKTDQGKRSVKDDTRILHHRLAPPFRADRYRFVTSRRNALRNMKRTASGR